MTTVAEVRLWGRRIGAVALGRDRQIAEFEYDPEFARSEIEVAPITMPLSRKVYRFPELSSDAFHGLPGLLADSLPDRFGSALINAWLARQGRAPQSLNPVERLCYVGQRGMGALEYLPATGPDADGTELQIDHLVELASDVLAERAALNTTLANQREAEALTAILQVGTSAGGARAKAVIAWNPVTGEVRSGQLPAASGFEPWLIKFDGVSGNRDKELEDPAGYGAIEYAYYLMASACGINMAECRLLEENGRRHFMARRFDRTEEGRKLHMQSLGALAHFDFDLAGAYGYEQALQVMQQLGLSMAQREQQFRRMAFNVIARNQDDHVKNIAFLMTPDGQWQLSPAYDVTYSYNPQGQWTSQHQMTLNGKRDDFTLADFAACEQAASLKRGLAQEIVGDVQATVRDWPRFAEQARLPEATMEQVRAAHRLGLS